MNSASLIAKHLREVHVGGNWTVSNLKDQLADVTWQQATTQVKDMNTIAKLVFHINYFVSVVIPVLQGKPLVASDKYAFDVPEITSDEEWRNLVDKAMADAETLAVLIEGLSDEQLAEDFYDAKWKSYYFNLQGIVEHTHYHLGQIALIKKLV